MKNNAGQPSTPLGLFSARLRLCSVNSPFISPLRIIPSPYINDQNFFDSNQANTDLNHFQLQQNAPNHKQEQEIEENVKQQSEIQLPPISQDQQCILLDEKQSDQLSNNMLDFILKNINRNPKKIQTARNNLESYGSQFNKKLFDYLISKFKKLRKTKEQMVKYCVRKSFKHITNKMRSANKQAYINMENNQVVAQYFQQNCQGDLSISMPFKKDSQQKTMNSNFLKKIFKCRQYNADYREFLKQFPNDFNFDNKKKIKSMNQSIKKCLKNKCFKSLDQYKRLPWTTEILQRIFQFAKKLMEHSPYRKQYVHQKSLGQEKDQEAQSEKQSQIEKNNEQIQSLKVHTKKNVIILTPPVRALQAPQGILQQQFLQKE